MKIERMSVCSVMVIEASDGVTYERWGAGCWCYRVGESTESLYGEREDEMEALYKSHLDSLA